ncbi:MULTISPECIES: hypothetical protein [unclassified Pseudomonas]|uniref:hypothetical protein n=1 Tax=unclassified Pseudomonas TaxID=196821 RepID=UPI000D35BC32|nr:MULTISPECIES: hypothetical protein [unclassified Pseudomonas]PTT14806.1 hypothetical protein DBR14_02860 [Pseudomonas sp. HMWF034]
MYKFGYELFGFYFELSTDSREMEVYLSEALEKHIVVADRATYDFKLFIPFIDPIKRRYLTRTAPNTDCILEEVEFKSGSSQPSKWSSTAPPLIPFNFEGIDSNFFAYHAAAVNAPNVGTVLLLGNKGAGKSTNSLAFCKSLGWNLLADETCVVRSKDLVIQALLRQPQGYTVDSEGYARKSALKFSDNLWINTQKEGIPVLACELIFIPGIAEPHIEKVNDRKIAKSILGRHQLNFGGTPEFAAGCSENLVNKLDVFQIYHGGYKTFSHVQKFIASTVDRMSQ